jgi:hypothetical protein
VSRSADPTATATAAPTDNLLTRPTPGSVEGMTSDARSALDASPPAATSAANLNVIQRASQGEIEVPDLGRVAVVAREREGGIDVRVATLRASSTEALLPHAVAMAADVRAAHVPLRRLDIETNLGSGAGGARGEFGAGSDTASPDSRADDTGVPQEPQGEDGSLPPRSDTLQPNRGRVRIVL